MSTRSSLPSPSRTGFSRLLFFAFIAFPAVQSVATLFSRSRRDASRFVWQGVAQIAAAGWGKTGQGLEHWVLELGAMLEGGMHEIGGHRRSGPFPPLR
ncbi:hypothetical protein [Methylacidimicrobium sp. B4]|uniref:hypothetical protein n=1 Tax=Methylacidimicrobium sp. B4 TaxID=2796139 RepID=UPI001A906B2D|nr:hypothetical protein [Methylacidimicrobium sp. B4]QSR85017.1 hypothetical protein MacB4_01745 [Methylacidimicrobium sp. B4]